MLALAHHVEHLVNDGKLPSYAAAARTLGVTRARLTQIMNLLLIATPIQERILRGELKASERRMRTVVAEPEWTVQLNV